MINNYVAATYTWLTQTFPPEVCASKQERAIRLLEEALELAQASGVSTDAVDALVRHVYAKPPGDARSELVDVLICTLAAAGRYKLDLTGQWERTLKARRENRAVIAAKWHHKPVVALELRLLQRPDENPV